MKCPYVIGRDVWDREGQESVDRSRLKFPPSRGKKPSPKGVFNRSETGRPRFKMVVVVVVAVVVVVVVVDVVVVAVAVVLVIVGRC